MSLRDPGDNKFASAGDFGLASDGGRSLPMEYDDVKFIDKDCQLAEKDDYESNTTGHRQGLPRFDLGEHIEVQLGFDSLDDSVLLQDQSQREENWGSHFSREENGVLGLEADSQNIEFSSTATETCTISRHINVWSEATSSESVQMLLNSVGEDEENIVEPSIERLDTHESVDGSNATESNEPKIECLPSNTGVVLDVQCERTTEMDKQVLEKSAMDVTDNNQDIPMCLEPAADSRLEKTSASKQENQGCIPKDEHASEKCKMELQSEKLYAGKQTIITEEENTSKQVIEASKEDTFPSEIRGSSATVQGESRKENTEDVMGKDNIVANLQGGPDESSLDELIENNTVSFHSQTSQSVNSESQFKKSAFDKMIKDATDSSHVDVAMTEVRGKSALVTDNINNRNPVKDASETAAEDDTSVKMHKMPDPSEKRDKKAENCADIRTSHEQDLGPLQAILDPMEIESNEDNSQKHVIEPSTKDALPVCDDEKSRLNGEQGLTCSDNQSREENILLQENNNDKSTVAEDDISVKMEIKPDLLQSGNNKPEVHVDVKIAHVQDFGQKQEISDAMEVEGISDHTEKHALGFSHENVILEETQRNQHMILDNNNEHNGEKRLTEASNKDFLHTCNVEKSKHEDEQGVSTGDKCLVKTGIILKENTEERRDDDVETENISAENTVVASCSKLADTDFEGQNDGVTSGIIRQAKSDCQVEESEAVVISLEHKDSASVPSTGGVVDNISKVSSFSNLNVEPGIMPPIEHSTPQVTVKSPVSPVDKMVSNISEVSSFSNLNVEPGIMPPIEHSTPHVTVENPVSPVDKMVSNISEVSSFSNLNVEPGIMPPIEHSTPEVTVENPVSPVHKMVSNISKVSSFCNLNIEPGIMPLREHSTPQVTVENPVSSQGDQNQSVLSITAKKHVREDIGSLVGVVFQKPLLEASSFSTQKESAKMQEVGKTQENETKHTSSEAVLTAGENETMGGVVDSPERKDTSVLQVDIETHKHISEAVSVQFTEEVALPAEEAMTGTCQEPLQINDTGATPTLDTELIKQNDELDQEFEKGVKEVDMPCVSRVQDDGNRDSALLASCCSTQNETANVQGFRTQDSCTLERGDAAPVEVGQKQENEVESVSVKSVVAPRENETVEEATGSPKRKTTLLPQTKIGTGECGHSRAVAFQNPHESTLPPEQVVTGTSQESLQINDACTTSDVDDTKQTDQVSQSFEGGKEASVPVDSTVQDDKRTEATLSIDKVQSKPTSDSGDTSQQTLVIASSADISEKEGFKKAGEVEEVEHSPTVVASKETEQSEKDKDTSEVMEVSLEVGISLEPDNDSPAREGDGNNLQASLPQPIDDKDSAEIMEIPSPGKLSKSKNGGDKVDMYGTARDLKRKSLSQSDDTFKFPVVTMNVTSGGAVDFPPSGQIVKDIGYWKPFQAAQSSEVRKENVSAVCQTGEFQAEASKKNANHVSRSTAVSVTNLIVQEVNIGSSELKAKSAPSGEKSRQASCVKELEKKLEKKSRSHREKSVESQVTSLCMTSVGPGNHPSNVCTGQEPKTSLTNPISASSTQLTVSSAVQTSTLPDLNATVAPASVLFQQPFTDSQQVQLRAQILVYGSLIQGSLPEEALMVTAFADIGVSQNGTPLVDGGRSLWDNAWHTAADRIHRKTFTSTSDVPIHTSCSATPSAVSSKIVEGTKTPNPALVSVTDSRSSPVPGMRSADMAASRSHPLQTRAVGTHSVGRAGNKNAPSAIMSPPRPVTLSSPVWGMSTSVNEGMQGSIPRSLHIDPHQMAATRHLYQSPQLGHYPQPGSSNPWISPLHYPPPWLGPPQGTLPEPGLPFSSFVVPEVTQESLNNRRMPATNVPHAPMTHVIPHFPGMAVPSTGHVSNAKTDTASKGAVGVGRQSSNEHKSRKRKKKSVSEEIAPTGGLKPSGAQVTPVTTVSKRPSSSTPVSSQGPPMAVTTSSNALVALPTSTSSMPSVSQYQIISRGETEQRVIFSEETASRIEQAKLNAEEAASVAAAAVRNSQGIWSQLAAQKSSGLVSECEAKLASAAVAAAAAASVAKAAAAAAKVAADAAVQAKVMATEALNSDGKSDSSQTSDVRLLEGNQGHSRSIIAAARETAKKRVEAASAATKRAQNLDAVVRAAELAAQAVTQAGAVVAMGDPVPLSLSALLEAGPEAYWKLVTQQAGIQRDDNVHSETLPQEIVTQNVEKNIIHSKSKNRKDAFTKETTRNVEEPLKNSSTEALKQVEKGCKLISDVAPHNIVSTDKDSIAPTENQVASTTQTEVAVSDAEAFSREAAEASEVERKTESNIKALASTSNEIKEGSFVEVVSDEEGLRGVWFSAKVLSLKDGKAFVRYDELLSDEGRGQLQEWIPLEGENGKPPRIRVAHPMTVMKFEGTRKRRRAAMGSYVWSIGDRVDAWIRDGWWEGIIMDKKDDDESKLTVHFPGEGDTSIIKAWNLRPSLIWKDGQWVEWTNLMAEKEGRHEDDLPSEKRQKLDKPDTAGETRGKEKLLKIPNLEEAKKTQELNTVMLSGKDKSHVAAKNSSEDGSSTGIRLNQIGLQREGSKVVFGVPKPTKKRKFMDVSKHYVAERMTRNSPDGKSSGKFDKHKAPVFQSQTGLKVTNKVPDKKFKRPIFSKPKDLKSSRGQDGQSKTKSEKDKSSASNPPVTSENMGQEMVQLSMPAFGNDGSKGGRRLALVGSVPNTKSGEASHPSFLKEVETHRSQSSTKINAPSAESDPGSKGKQSSASDSSTHNIEKAASRQEVAKDKVPEKAITDMVEPRRSNRKIQPTSRLLEGLQTSPTIVKSSAASHFHDKGGKVQLKSSSSIPKGNFNG